MKLAIRLPVGAEEGWDIEVDNVGWDGPSMRFAYSGHHSTP